MADTPYISSSELSPEDRKLIEKLSRQLSSDEAQNLQQSLDASSFTKDALDGLRAFEQAKQLNKNVRQINKKLLKTISQKRHNKKRSYQQLIWIASAIIIILLTIFAAFIVIRLKN